VNSTWKIKAIHAFTYFAGIVASMDMTFGSAQSPIIMITLTRQGPPFMRTRRLKPTSKAASKKVAADIHMGNLENLQLVVRLSGLPNRDLRRKKGLS
jgi:hypothetical protein